MSRTAAGSEAGAAPTASPPEGDGAYSAVEAPDAWHVLSLACFAVALAARPVARTIAPLLPFFRYRFLLPLAVILFSSALGCLLALVGLRRPAIRAASRLALFFNAVALGLGLLALAGGFWIFYR